LWRTGSARGFHFGRPHRRGLQATSRAVRTSPERTRSKVILKPRCSTTLAWLVVRIVGRIPELAASTQVFSYRAADSSSARGTDPNLAGVSRFVWSEGLRWWRVFHYMVGLSPYLIVEVVEPGDLIQPLPDLREPRPDLLSMSHNRSVTIYNSYRITTITQSREAPRRVGTTPRPPEGRESGGDTLPCTESLLEGW